MADLRALAKSLEISPLPTKRSELIDVIVDTAAEEDTPELEV